jgi:uncharacterized protein YjlB
MTEETKNQVRPEDAVSAHRFEGDGEIPNNVLPLLVYPGAVEVVGADPAAAFERVFAANGWGRSWRNGIFPYPHFHSTAHEVLGIARGEAKVRFGGAGGAVLTVGAGDVVVIPAGVGHQNLGASADLLVVGAYPGGSEVDLWRGGAAERAVVERNVAAVPLPAADPVHGAEGPLLRLWRDA